MGHENSDRDEVGLAEMVDEAADVAVEPGVYAVQLSVLGGVGETIF